MRLEDGWCKNFDKDERLCKIYDNRPDFCKVDRARFQQIYGVQEELMDDFCTYCCRNQISEVYGRHSTEASNYENALQKILEL